MSTFSIVMIVIAIILIAAIIALIFLTKKAEKKQAEQQAQLEAASQTMTMLIIDKGRLPLKDAGLPEMVVNNTPKYLRRSKVTIVKAKIGPKIMTLMCDADIFPLVTVKKEVKASVSGIYITSVKGLRGPLETPQKKKGFFARMRDKAGKNK